MAGTSKSSAPGTVAEGLGNVLRAISDTLQAPDATQFAGPLMHLQTTVLDMVHGKVKTAAGPQQAPGAPGGAAAGAPPQPPPGAGGGAGLGGGLSGMMGQAQGPSSATSGGGPSPSGMDPEEMRQMALTAANQ